MATQQNRTIWAQRRLLALGLLSLFCLVGLGCGKPYQEIDDHPCPSDGTTLRFASFGQGFMDGYCQSCHGSQAADRMGAPGDFIFDTAEQCQRHRARIFVRAAASNDSMPPGPLDPPREARDLLAEWLACGAP